MSRLHQMTSLRLREVVGATAGVFVAIAAILPFALRSTTGTAVIGGILASAAVAATLAVTSEVWARRRREAKPDVFLSYSFESRDVVASLVSQLRDAGLRVWDPA